jgi:hypothetical protein
MSAPKNEQFPLRINVQLNLLEPFITRIHVIVPEDGSFHIAQGRTKQTYNRPNLRTVLAAI